MKIDEIPTNSLDAFSTTLTSLTCDELAELLEQMKGLFTGSNLEELSPDKPVIFHGDLHGDVETVFRLWSRLGDRDRYQLVFLGDYIDRGPNQIEALLLVGALKAQRPEEVVVLRGNHELDPRLSVYPHDYPEQLKWRCGSELGTTLYKISLDLFSKMPLYALYRDYIGLHGGPPFSILHKCKGRPCLMEKSLGVLEDVLWSDPDELLGQAICSWNDSLEECIKENYYRGVGRIWGAGATREFLERVGMRKIVRGHTSVEGHAIIHNKSVITLFTRSGPPYYNSRASVLVVDGDEKIVSLNFM
ncbi:hypothetical protein IPA_00655 [Ignicoccus pacificus DSM 13166]|uniref:Serine/threonine specific protein phosphatases domain-containing protein n=1 Tax=Ignicoccus pacificus DSM 13166 TaxID=940294 RepID=A0A977KAD0_9CREN|nr:hypothetical protein IPA_00655 [Ignicoccus pacificus DSM 13166]